MHGPPTGSVMLPAEGNGQTAGGMRFAAPAQTAGDEAERLVAWFSSAVLPREPFNLAPHARVLQPDLSYAVLRGDLADGPRGARWRAALGDLHRLHRICQPEGRYAAATGDIDKRVDG
jgi:hypothetical protein